MGEAVHLLRKGVLDAIQGVGFPPLEQLMQKMIEHEVSFYVWKPCSVARGVKEEDLQGKNAHFAGPDDLADLLLEADRVLSF